MRRVFEKLRGLYQRKVMKRFAWLRFFLVMLSIWVVSQKHQLLSHEWGGGCFFISVWPRHSQNGHLPLKHFIFWRKPK